MIVEEEEVDRNPVANAIHKRQQVRRAPRPLSTDATEALTAFVFATNDPALKLAFSLGLECGLRGGETCNVRLEDVDRSKNEIIVRLPMKNMLERSVPFHNLVASCLDEWLPLRQAQLSAARSTSSAMDDLVSGQAIQRSIGPDGGGGI